MNKTKDVHFKFVDNNKMKVEGLPEYIYMIREHFSFLVDGYQYSKKFKYGTWDGYIRIMDFNGYMPVGLIDNAISFVKSKDLSYSMDDEFKVKNNFTKQEVDKWLDEHKIYRINGKGEEVEIETYWYQKHAITDFIRNKRATFLMPTSSGKSLVQALITKFHEEKLRVDSSKRTLIIVPTTQLLTQMKSDFMEYNLYKNEDIALVGGDRNNKKGGSFSPYQKALLNFPNAKIVITTFQSGVKFTQDDFDEIDFVMVDECHNAKNDSIQSMVDKLSHVEYRVGLTGTLESDKKGAPNVLQIIGLFGRIYKHISTKQLIKEGKATNLQIISLVTRHRKSFTEMVSGMPYADEIDAILASKERNKFIVKLATQLWTKKENIFIMFRYTDHGKILYELLHEVQKKLGVEEPNVFFINGEVKTEDRDRIKHLTEKNDGVIIVASEKTFSTGISIKNLKHVILATPIKSEITVIQTIGRLLRLHENKDKAYFWDIMDDLSKKNKNGKTVGSSMNYALKHALERLKYYRSEGHSVETRKIQL